MEELGLGPTDRNVVVPAREKAQELREKGLCAEVCPVFAMQMSDGSIITGRKTDIMNATSAAILNAIKHLANIDDDMHLISPVILEPIKKLKLESLGSKNVILDAEEVLIALSISAVTNPVAEVAMKKLKGLAGCEAHSTTILDSSSEQILRKLQIEVTSEPVYMSAALYESK
jgi:uncharacterized protein (UPF0371 family)